MSFDAELHDQARVVSENNQPHAGVGKVVAQDTEVSLSDCDYLKKFWHIMAYTLHVVAAYELVVAVSCETMEETA